MKSSEEKSEMFSIMINIFTRVVTMILVVTSIILKITGHAHNIQWSINDVWGILFIGLVSGLAFGIFYIKPDMSKLQTLALKIIYFLLLNAVLLFTGLRLGWFEKDASSLTIMEAMFAIIYFAVNFLVYLLDFNEAKKINQKLHDRKKLRS